jgi:carbon monoxide dehydrogenase subunit G
MQVQQEFTVSNPPERVWPLFRDVPSMVQCLPGATLLETRLGGVFVGQLAVKLGPITATFDGTAQVAWDDEKATGTISGSGADKRGGSRGKLDVAFALTPQDSGTKVLINADLTVSGTAAQFARPGIVSEITSRMIAQFVQCLESKLQASCADEALTIEADEIRALPLMWASFRAWLGRVFCRTPR